MPFLSTPDTIVVQLTKEGRNLLARCKFGEDLVYRHLGWQMGRGGYDDLDPVKIIPIADLADESVGYIEVLDNTFDAGDAVVLNTKSFIFGTHWLAGPNIPVTVENIISAILDSKDPKHHRLVNVDVDPGNPNRIRFTSTVTGNVLAGRTLDFTPIDVDIFGDVITMPNHGLVKSLMVNIGTTGTLPGGTAALTDYFIVPIDENTFQLSTTLNAPTLVDFTTQGTGIHSIIPVGNLYPIDHAETVGLGSTINFAVTPMSLAVSTTLLDPAYPVPPTLGTFVLPDGKIELPTTDSVSFLMRIPDGPVGMNGYGEIGLWVEVLESTHPMEKTRKVLFAHGHFPLQAKTDRHLYTYRLLVSF